MLINKLNIRNEHELELAERDLTMAAARDIQFCPPPYDFPFLLRLHDQLFCDVFAWAGQVRAVDIAKNGTRFCSAQRIHPEAQKLFEHLGARHWLERPANRDELIVEIAEFAGDLNMIHPFREGNGRTLRLLCEMVVINAGFEIDWARVDQPLWLQASVDAVTCDYAKMRSVFDLCIGERFCE